MTEVVIQTILSEHWQKKTPAQIAALVKARHQNEVSVEQVSECIQTFTLRHHGKPVRRKDWPC